MTKFWRFDYDSFFENIWHDLLLVKLHKAGIKGKILKIMYNYLKNRKFCFEVNGYVKRVKRKHGRDTARRNTIHNHGQCVKVSGQDNTVNNQEHNLSVHELCFE